MTTQPFKLGQKTRKGQFCKAQTESGRCLLSSMNLPMWQVHSGGRSSSTKERADSASDPHLALLDNSMHLGHVNDGTSTDMDGPRSRGTDHSAPAALKSTSGRANRPLNLCRWWDCLQQYDVQLQVRQERMTLKQTGSSHQDAFPRWWCIGSPGSLTPEWQSPSTTILTRVPLQGEAWSQHCKRWLCCDTKPEYTGCILQMTYQGQLGIKYYSR